MRTNRNNHGFTLVELMIVIAVIGVLAAIAYPSYMEYVRKTNRSDAKVLLNDVAQQLQRCYTTYSVYNSPNCTIAVDLMNGALITSRQPQEHYSVVGELTAATYTLTVSPRAVSPQVADANKCATFVVDNTGAKTATGSEGDGCW